MSMGAFIRRTIFWNRDRLFNQGNIYNAYKDASHVNSNQNEKTEREVQEKLDNLLKHATQTTEFYTEFEGFSIYDFPVINKQTIIDNRENIFSKAFLGRPLHEMQTSGSLGTPFVIQQDMRKRQRVIAEIKAMNDLAQFPSHEKLLYILGAARRTKYPPFKEWKENFYRIGVAANDEQAMKKIVDFLIDKKPFALHASASNIPPILDYIQRNAISSSNFALRRIITGGEMVPEQLRFFAEEVFGPKCKVIVKYSNEEMGILAQDTGAGTPYLLNVSNYFFEILKMDSDEPCFKGESGRIVITDLYNYSLPMIRYDTGDVGRLEDTENGWPVLVDLSGKRRDLIFNTKGDSISGAAITNLLKHVEKVRQWQLIQNAEKQYTYKLVPEKDTTPSDEDILLQDMHDLLGQDASIKIEFEDSIPATHSGKRRYTVNLYKPQ